MSLKWVIFDLDNTLIKTREAAKKGDEKVFKYLEKRIKISWRILYKEWKKIVEKLKKSKNPKNRERKKSYSLLLKKLKIRENVKKLLKIFEKELLKNLKINKKAYKVLKKYEKYNLAIITESSREIAIKKLKKTKLLKYFSLIITSSETKIMKPSRKYFELFIKKTKVKPSEVLFISNDYKKDLLPAKKFGFKILKI